MTHPAFAGLLEEKLSHSVIGAFYKVHRVLGYGFLEHTYRNALELELRNRGHLVAREVSVSVWYEKVEISRHRLDMLVDNRLVLELKASNRLPAETYDQLFNYLRATDLEVGLVLHFGRQARFRRVICQNHYKDRP